MKEMKEIKQPSPPPFFATSPARPFGLELSHSQSDPNSDVEFNDLPVDAQCPYCRKPVVTLVEYKSSCLTWTLAFIVLIILGWISFFVLPFVWPLLQDSCHQCSQCGNQLSRKHRISLPKVSNSVVTMRCGTCAVVLSLRWAMVVAAMFSFIAMAYMGRYYVRYVGIPDVPKGPLTDQTWAEYLTQCGIRSYLGNPLHATATFDKQFRQRTVVWEGRMMRVSEGIFSKRFMYLRMDPPQYPGPAGIDRPDLGLIFDTKLEEKVSEITLGDLVKFEATLITLASRGQPHFGVMWDVDVIAAARDLPVIHQDRGVFFISNLGMAPIQRIPEIAKRIHHQINPPQPRGRLVGERYAKNPPPKEDKHGDEPVRRWDEEAKPVMVDGKSDDGSVGVVGFQADEGKKPEKTVDDVRQVNEPKEEQ